MMRKEIFTIVIITFCFFVIPNVYSDDQENNFVGNQVISNVVVGEFSETTPVSSMDNTEHIMRTGILFISANSTIEVEKQETTIIPMDDYKIIISAGEEPFGCGEFRIFYQGVFLINQVIVAKPKIIKADGHEIIRFSCHNNNVMVKLIYCCSSGSILSIK